MIVVKAKKHYAGRTLVLPVGLGSQSFSKDATIELEDEKAHALIACNRDFSYLDPKKDDPDYVEETESGEVLKEKSESDELGSKDKDNGSQSIIHDLDDDEKAELIKALPAQTKKALTELAGAFPGGEWRDKTKEQLIAYLTEKLKS